MVLLPVTRGRWMPLVGYPGPVRGILPAAGLTGLLLLASSLWDLLRLVALQNTLVGIAGGPLLNWTGPGADGDGWWLWVALPLLLGALVIAGSAAVLRLPRLGLPLFAAGAAAQAAWTVLVGLLGLGNVLDTWLHGSLLFLTYPHASPWEAWGRWVFDGTVLVMLALLTGFGPRVPTARRAVFVGMVILAVDQAFRIGVTVLSGSVPFLWEGLGPLDAVQTLVWLVLGALGVGFVAVVGNVPGADGPPRRGLLVALGLAGLVYGLEASALYGLGLLHVLGVETQTFLAMPLYPGLLGLLRLGMVAVGGLAVGLGRYREIDVHTSAAEVA